MGETFLYRHFDKANQLLYIGISLSAVQRLSQHRDASHWFKQIRSVTIESFPSREAALEAERECIFREKPIHNVVRPISQFELKKKTTHAEESRKALLRRVVNFSPLYSLKDAGQVLQMGPGQIQRLINENKIGSLVIPSRYGNGKMRTMITGWQIIDYLESVDSREIAANG